MKPTRLSQLIAFAGLAVAAAIFTARAAYPLAGTPIGNQAKATYTDDSAVTREVFSNTVITLVAQVAGLDLETNLQEKIATPGSQVYFPHTVTNTGNGTDTYALSSAQLGGDNFDLTSFAIYADTNQDGLPDNYTAITTTGPLAPGGEFHVVLVGIVPPARVADDKAEITITATSGHTGALNETNKDTVKVVNGAVMQVTKAISQPSGLPGLTPVRYTLTYTNTGNAAAANFTLKDIVPAGLTYVAESARWSIGSTALTDDADGAQGGAPNQITYRFENGAGDDTLEAVITSVAAGQSGYITFEVSVDSRAAFTARSVSLPTVVNNKATYTFDAHAADAFQSNTVPFTVVQEVSVTFDGETIAGPVPAGSTVVFNNVLTNTGSGIDTFDVTVNTAGSTFPAGTTFQLFQSDGATPLVDSNGNTTPDTGPVASGASYTVVLKAILPTNASGDNGGAGFSVVKTATSTVDSSVSDPATDSLGEITGASVDLTNNIAAPGGTIAGTGLGVYVPGNVIITNTTNPGTTTSFNLYVANTGPFADSFNMLADDDGTFGTSNDLPVGWTVVFKKAGVVVSTTGSIPSGGNTLITAEVSIPAGYPAATYPIYFKSASPINAAATDSIRDAITVNVVRGLSLQTDNVGQVFPGGSVVYEHILKNNSNVLEADAAVSTVTFTLADSLSTIGFTSVLYYDINNNSILDVADPVIVSGLHTVKAAGLAIGEQVRIFVKVFAPLGAPDNASDATTLTATVTDGTHTAPIITPLVNLDTTSVTRGDLAVVKRQAVDADDDGEPDGAYVTDPQVAAPGVRILYEITVTNTGSANATNITVSDAIPANTTYSFVAATSSEAQVAGGTVNTVNALLDGAAAGSSFTFTVGTLAPAESAVMTFGVKVNE